MKRFHLALIILVVFSMISLLYGCDSDDFDFSGCDCEEEIDDLEDERGAPDDEEKTFEGGVHTLTYWYNQDGFAQTFRWGDGTDLCCETSFSTIDNQAPVAQNQTVLTTVNTPVDITLTATDVDGDALTYQVITPPANGILSGVAPDLTYTPNSDFSGTDRFTFRANDGRIDSLPAAVQITVSGSDDGGVEPPVEPEPVEPGPSEPESRTNQ